MLKKEGIAKYEKMIKRLKQGPGSTIVDPFKGQENFIMWRTFGQVISAECTLFSVSFNGLMHLMGKQFRCLFHIHPFMYQAVDR